ncbi:MAG: polysaccharide pyruvyl transferase family protein [Acutalibacteraceae bacterium]
MRYALITIHDTQNYGSLLQTYSTYKAVESLGKDITLLDYHNAEISAREIPITERPIKSPKDLVKRLVWGRDQKRKYDGVHSFLNQHTNMSKPYYIDNISEANQDYDAFITGSDIVWGTNITGCDMTYFLDFADDTKRRLAFSSSAGTRWTEDEQKKIKPLIEKYDAVSVREQLAADWIKELTGKNVPVTCDPTMLWKPDFWAKFVLDDYAPKEPYVLIYAVNPDHKNITDGIKYAQENGMTAYFINFYSPVRGTKTIRPVTVQQWITLFANANTVFSASYHGLLFSLYFKKSVFFYNRGEKSRMISLSQELHIENREGTDENITNDMPIDYEFVYSKLDEKREYSWDVLKSEL